MASRIDPWAWSSRSGIPIPSLPFAALLVFALLHALVVVAACLDSVPAVLSAALIALPALCRYGAMACFARFLGTRNPILTTLAAGAWLIFLGVLAVGLVAVARKMPSAIPWAVAAACLGPFCLTAFAAFLGFRSLGGRALPPEGALQGGAP